MKECKKKAESTQPLKDALVESAHPQAAVVGVSFATAERAPALCEASLASQGYEDLVVVADRRREALLLAVLRAFNTTGEAVH